MIIGGLVTILKLVITVDLPMPMDRVDGLDCSERH